MNETYPSPVETTTLEQKLNETATKIYQLSNELGISNLSDEGVNTPVNKIQRIIDVVCAMSKELDSILLIIKRI